MKFCINCVLSDNLFSVKIGKNGICNHCFAESTKKEIQNEQDIKLKSNNKNYDVVLAYSGGKDSTYTLYMLREKYKAKVLAVTFDNGFLTETTYNNIRNVCSELDVDSLIIAPSTRKLYPIFNSSLHDDTIPPKALERASAICTYCIGLVKMNVYKEAILRNIPYVAFGWTPGQVNLNKQVIKLDSAMIKMNFSRMIDNILKQFDESYKSILLTDDTLDKYKDQIPALFYPFMDDNYNEEEIINKIVELGWERPRNTDGNSTNCLLNTYAIYKHKQKYGFHPYALELSHLVRTKVIGRHDAMKRIMEEDNLDLIQSIENKLNSYS